MSETANIVEKMEPNIPMQIQTQKTKIYHCKSCHRVSGGLCQTVQLRELTEWNASSFHGPDYYDDEEGWIGPSRNMGLGPLNWEGWLDSWGAVDRHTGEGKNDYKNQTAWRKTLADQSHRTLNLTPVSSYLKFPNSWVCPPSTRLDSTRPNSLLPLSLSLSLYCCICLLPYLTSPYLRFALAFSSLLFSSIPLSLSIHSWLPRPFISLLFSSLSLSLSGYANQSIFYFIACSFNY